MLLHIDYKSQYSVQFLVKNYTTLGLQQYFSVISSCSEVQAVIVLVFNTGSVNTVLFVSFVMFWKSTHEFAKPFNVDQLRNQM